MRISSLILLLMLSLPVVNGRQVRACPADTAARHFSYSVFPILMYDSDIGVGLGGKGTV